MITAPLGGPGTQTFYEYAHACVTPAQTLRETRAHYHGKKHTYTRAWRETPDKARGQDKEKTRQIFSQKNLRQTNVIYHTFVTGSAKKKASPPRPDHSVPSAVSPQMESPKHGRRSNLIDNDKNVFIKGEPELDVSYFSVFLWKDTNWKPLEKMHALTDTTYPKTYALPTREDAHILDSGYSGHGGTLDGMRICMDGGLERKWTHGALISDYADYKNYNPPVDNTNMDPDVEALELYVRSPQGRAQLEDVLHSPAGVRLWGAFEDDDPVADLKGIPMDTRLAAKELGTNADPVAIRRKMAELEAKAASLGTMLSESGAASKDIPDLLHSASSSAVGHADKLGSKRRGDKLSKTATASDISVGRSSTQNENSGSPTQKTGKPRLEFGLPQPLFKSSMNPFVEDPDGKELEAEEVDTAFPTYRQDQDVDNRRINSLAETIKNQELNLHTTYEETKVLRKHYVPKQWKP